MLSPLTSRHRRKAADGGSLGHTSVGYKKSRRMVSSPERPERKSQAQRGAESVKSRFRGLARSGKEERERITNGCLHHQRTTSAGSYLAP